MKILDFISLLIVLYCEYLRDRFVFLEVFGLFNIWSLLPFRMDPALLRERELFKKRALSTPAVEKRPAASESGSHKKKKPKVDKEGSSGSKATSGKCSRKAVWIIYYTWFCFDVMYVMVDCIGETCAPENMQQWSIRMWKNNLVLFI